jgi:hypothetical protein
MRDERRDIQLRGVVHGSSQYRAAAGKTLNSRTRADHIGGAESG